jgi:hypothetical protein
MTGNRRSARLITTAERHFFQSRDSQTHSSRSAWVADATAARSLEDVELVPQGENLELQHGSRAHAQASGAEQRRDCNGGACTYFVEAVLVSEEGWPW